MWRSRGVVARALGARGRPRGTGTARCSGPAALQDLAVPNGSWSAAMREHYERLLRRTADGSWRRVPSYRNVLDHFPAAAGQGMGTRLFLRSTDTEGAGFEYVTFLHSAGNRVLCLCQPGPYLEGHPGFMHGGAIATIIDTTLGTCALAAAGRVMTAKLSIDFLAPVPLGSVVLVDGGVDRRDGRKIFLSCQVRGATGDTLHAEATALFIQLDAAKSPPATCLTP